MKKTLQVNPASVEETGEKLQIDGINVEIHLSVYDTPTAVSARRDAVRNEIVISFRYPDEEPHAPAARLFAGNVQIIEGRHSGKVLELRIPLPAGPITEETLKSRLETAFCEREKSNPPIQPLRTVGRRLNQRIAKRILERDFHELIGG